jgi:hypothetical protein
MEDHHADFWVAVAAAGPILLVAATVTINTKNLAPAHDACDAELLAGSPQLARGARTSPCIRTHLLRSSAPIMTSTTPPNHGYGVPPMET